MSGNWNHIMCDACWQQTRGDNRQPHRLRMPDYQSCCWCGGTTGSGIYVRHDPGEVEHCLGHDDDD